MRKRCGAILDTPLQDALFPKLVHYFWQKFSAVQDNSSKRDFDALEIEVSGSKCFDKSLPEGAPMTTRVDVATSRTKNGKRERYVRGLRPGIEQSFSVAEERKAAENPQVNWIATQLLKLIKIRLVSSSPPTRIC